MGNSVGNGNLKPFKKGKDPRRGRGTKKGHPRVGRPPDKFREIMRQVASRDEVIKRLRQLTSAKNLDDELFLKAFKEVVEKGYPRGMESEVTFPINPAQLTDEQLERIANGENPLMVLATTRGG